MPAKVPTERTFKVFPWALFKKVPTEASFHAVQYARPPNKKRTLDKRVLHCFINYTLNFRSMIWAVTKYMIAEITRAQQP